MQNVTDDQIRQAYWNACIICRDMCSERVAECVARELHVESYRVKLLCDVGYGR